MSDSDTNSDSRNNDGSPVKKKRLTNSENHSFCSSDDTKIDELDDRPPIYTLSDESENDDFIQLQTSELLDSNDENIPRRKIYKNFREFKSLNEQLKNDDDDVGDDDELLETNDQDKSSVESDIDDESSTEDDTDYREFRFWRHRRNSRKSYPAERRRKMVRERQMSLLREKRLKLLERKENELRNETVKRNATVIEKTKTIYNITSDESENDNRDFPPTSKQIESEDDEIIRYKSKRKDNYCDQSRTDDETSSGEEAEENRLKRLAEKQALFGIIETDRSTDPTHKLVLDYDTETKEELVTVDARLAARLKPHQREGVKFMWNTCFESIKQLKKRKGGGCILAHCMGLGKTLQIITLAHTLLTHEDTEVKSILILSPVSTILNWKAEFEKWLDNLNGKIKVQDLTKSKKNEERVKHLETWIQEGGVMIVGYEMFRSMLNCKKIEKNIRNRIVRALLDPGCDLVVCDEGHVLKNEKTALAKTVMKIKTLRRIVLTGTPLQNNLMEYFCMVRFTKPGLLGSRHNFQNRFGHTITKGQFQDSSSLDVSMMRQCAYILNKTVSGIIQRCDHNVLKPYLPTKREYVIIVGLSDIQAKLYQHYRKTYSMIASTYNKKNMKLLADYQKMRLIWTHPLAIKFSEERQPQTQKKWFNRSLATDEEESDESDFYATGSSNKKRKKTPKNNAKGSASKKSSTTSKASSSKCRTKIDFEFSGDEMLRAKSRKHLHLVSDDEMPEAKNCSQEYGLLMEDDLHWLNDSTDASIPDSDEKHTSDSSNNRITDSNRESTSNMNSEETEPWWRQLISDEALEDPKNGPKVILLFAVLKECEKMNEKLLIFSQSLPSLDLIEHFLEKSTEFSETSTQDSNSSTEFYDFIGEWNKGLDYFRLDGSTSKEDRAQFCNTFNDPENKRARLFLISTRAGGLGINLTAANRVIIFDTSWNPSNDVQSIFRVYRFGQTKPCYIYRFVSQGTMEQKIYERQVTKLSIALRVIDEEQIDRHFTREEVGDLYAFDRIGPMFDDLASKSVDDKVLTGMLKRYPDIIINLHEHDSFLESRIDEELTEEERRNADEEMNNTKAGDEASSNVKEKIRATIKEIEPSISGSDVDKLLESLVQYYSEEREKLLQATHTGAGRRNPFADSIPTDEHAKPNGPTTSGFEKRRPLFCMGIAEVRDVDADPEMLLMKQRALLHFLRTKPTDGSNEKISTPSTWKLYCNGKEPAELEEIFKSEFQHWWNFPLFSYIGSYLLVHFSFCVRRVTLEEKLGKHGIRTNIVLPDFDTVESLLGSYLYRTEKDDVLPGRESDDADDTNDDDYASFAQDCTDPDGSGYDSEYGSTDNDSISDSGQLYADEYYDSDEARKITKSFIL